MPAPTTTPPVLHGPGGYVAPTTYRLWTADYAPYDDVTNRGFTRVAVPGATRNGRIEATGSGLQLTWTDAAGDDLEVVAVESVDAGRRLLYAARALAFMEVLVTHPSGPPRPLRADPDDATDVYADLDLDGVNAARASARIYGA